MQITSTGRPARRRRRWRFSWDLSGPARRRAARVVAAVVAGAVAVGGLGVPANAAPGVAPGWRPTGQKDRPVPGRDLVPRARPADPAADSVLRSAPRVTWPAAGSAEVAVPAGSSGPAGPGRNARTDGSVVQWTQAGDLPVRVGAATGTGAPDRLRIEVLDQAAAERAGVRGLLVTVTPTVGRASAGGASGGRVPVEVDYSGFRSAYGGDWAARLRLVALPACAASTPERAECQTGQALPSRNDVRAGRVRADVPMSGATQVLAVTAAPSGSSGDFTATPLSASSSWSAGGSSGDFAWSYPLDVPPGLGGPEPELELEYSSGTIDGRTVSTNNQTSWVGEGWDLGTDYIERRYKSCSDDVSFSPKPYDLCWDSDNAFLALNGRSVELIRDTATGTWRPRDDDGSRVQLLTGAANGDNDGEYWKITDPDGTQYFFGLHRLPGWSTGREVTNSTWTVPVFGDDPGEPCHGSTFATSYCTQAWRWNLDYVVDPNENATSYFYQTETNRYGRNRTASAGTPYHRAGYLTRIDYGQRADSLYTAPAPMRVEFTVEERCAEGATCGTGTITKDTAKNWPDVPYDQNCDAGKACTGLFAPTFWTRKRLATVTTKLRSGSGYRDVDSWTFGWQFRDPGDGTSPSLWLASVTRRGHVGGTASMPPVTFQGLQFENRVDAAEGIPPMYKWRVTDVYDESGGHVRVNYSGKDCTRSTLPAPESNTRRCFPAYWVPEGEPKPVLDWFHKYVVTQVLEDDVAGVAGIEQTDYEYLGGAAWHYDDNALVPEKYRTWSQWRGYARVRTIGGAEGGVRSLSEVLYFRGMDGDKLPTGTRSVSVTDSEGIPLPDHAALAGFAREEITYTEVDGSELSGTIYDPWISPATATRGSTTAHVVEVAAERERTVLEGGGLRRTETRTTYDRYGLPTQIDDRGDLADPDDDQCTRITYARNTELWLIEFEAREETVQVPCSATPSYPADVVSDELTFYDGSTTLGAAPTRGDVTMTQEVASYTGNTPTYVLVERSVYDEYGRELESYDALGRRTTMAYTPASGGPVTAVTMTNPLGHVDTTTLEPAWGEPVMLTDANGRRTEMTYDPLGRVTAVWQPDRSRADGQSPNQRFSYLIRTDAPNVVTSEEIRDDGSYDVVYEFFDGRLRPRQTQTPAPDGGRLITDTFYDSRGLQVRENDEYWTSGTAGSTLFVVNDNAVPGQTVTVYDGADRAIAEIFLSYGVERWRTTTAYGGDRVHVIPPAGETVTTTIYDADEKMVELRQYAGRSPTGEYDATRYRYGAGGLLTELVDPAGNTWRYTYDVRGRKIREEDPDRGVTTFTYDAADQLLTSTDARGVTLAYEYDALGRRTGLYEGSLSGPKRAEWTYDTLANGTVVRGQLATATRYVDGHAYTAAVNGYDRRYRSLGSTFTIPAVEGALAGTYQVDTGYTPTGLPLLVSYPAAGGLPKETVRYGYDRYGRLTSAQSGLGTMLTAASYTEYDELSQLTLSTGSGRQLVQSYFYEEGTRRLIRSRTDRSTTEPSLADIAYTYDPSGNITRIADTPAGRPADVQCFTYDHLQRLTEAWTATDGCAGEPTPGVIGGAAPYWRQWSYDTVGNRRTETVVQPNSGTRTTRTYRYPTAGSARPHALDSVTGDGQTDSFAYDAAGNTIRRTVDGSTQTLSWDAEGHLATVTEGGKTTEYLYDADGNRLIRRAPEGTTLYLGKTELTVPNTAGATVSVTRQYDLGDVTAVRTAQGLSFQITDQHGTAYLTVNAADLTDVQRRYHLPFGESRGPGVTAWPNERGYVGGTVDPSTGLIHLGAREYDPRTGRFISVDPVLNASDPQQMNGYSYANNNPISANDADGRWPKWVKKLGKKIKKKVKKVVRKVKKKVKKVVRSVKKTVKRVKAAAKKVAKKVKSALKRAVKKARAVIKEYKRRATAVRDRVRSVVRAAKRKVVSAARWTAKKVSSATKKTASVAHRAARKTGAAVSTAVSAASTALKVSGALVAAAQSHLYNHMYVSASLCLMFCINVGQQGGTWSVTLTGGISSGSDPSPLRKLPWLQKIGGAARGYGGISIGYSTATVDEQRSQLAAVTVARGLLGGHGGFGQRSDNNGFYYFGGYSAGFGWALQGPATLSWEPGLNAPQPLGG
ncbi:RHS repeat-associated core domain-containing protein [Micromonospora sp. HM5-17]|uniref:RHS repeat-associated core domain-containing protein n=1 Tax=Micromonospora sp. HM5-17 TaxID=2487710 RepID=UPI0011CDD4F2|nr:RHS repeat-associated core domain-containing protein [Micromonospora sp. HM5-17]